MTEILFYHLSEKKLEEVIPGLLEKCLDRDWRVVVQVRTDERLQALDALLWNWREESFLPHGSIRDGTESMQPVWLTCQQDNPNGANVRFVLEGAEPPDLLDYARGVYIFEDHDPDEVARARERWKAGKEAAANVSYWQQNPQGGWDRKA